MEAEAAFFLASSPQPVWVWRQGEWSVPARCSTARPACMVGGYISGTVVFCMSCDSNELAQASLDAGAIGFVGFDKIPFNRFNDAGEPIGSHVLVKHC